MEETKEITPIWEYRLEKVEERLNNHEKLMERLSEVVQEVQTSQVELYTSQQQTNKLLEQGFLIVKQLLMVLLAAIGGTGYMVM